MTKCADRCQKQEGDLYLCVWFSLQEQCEHSQKTIKVCTWVCALYRCQIRGGTQFLQKKSSKLCSAVHNLLVGLAWRYSDMLEPGTTLPELQRLHTHTHSVAMMHTETGSTVWSRSMERQQLTLMLLHGSYSSPFTLCWAMSCNYFSVHHAKTSVSLCWKHPFVPLTSSGIKSILLPRSALGRK